MKTGRPRKGEIREPVRKVSVALAPSDVLRLRKIGGGNVSEGIRRLLAKES